MTKFEELLESQDYAINSIRMVIEKITNEDRKSTLVRHHDHLVGIRLFLMEFNKLLEHTL